MAESPTGKDSPRLGQPLRPGAVYYLVGAALTATLVSAAPFFWAPPFWLAALMARQPVGDKQREPARAAAANPATPAYPSRPPGRPANDNPAVPPRSASPRGGGTARA